MAGIYGSPARKTPRFLAKASRWIISKLGNDCQTRVQECTVVTPGDEANPSAQGNKMPRCEICLMVSPQGHIDWFYI